LLYGRLLARQRLQAARSWRQNRILHEHARQAFLDGIFKLAALAHQSVRFLIQARTAGWIEGAAENVEKLFTYHERTAKPRMLANHWVTEAL
jgi:hypothetical protein